MARSADRAGGRERSARSRGRRVARRPGTEPAPARCAWARGDLEVRYHDEEWGVPVRDDRMLYELLVLEGAQAGLSWSTILRKRESYRRAFAGFDPRKVATFTGNDVRRLLADAGIVRNRAKIEAAIANARAALQVQAAEGSFAALVWSVVDGRPVQNRWTDNQPAETDASRALSRELRRRGFRFVGPTICYAFMQAAGLVNDHAVGCFRHAEVRRLGRQSAVSRSRETASSSTPRRRAQPRR